MKKWAKKDILHAYGDLDVLNYYFKVYKVLKNFLKDKKIATKIHLKDFFFLKRGSNTQPLYINDFSVIDKKMLVFRKNHLKDVKDKLSEKQQLIWIYFPPRKMVQFFYATNDEGVGKPIERVFIDIDRGEHSSNDARTVALNLIEVIKKDKEFNKKLKYRTIILWTGSSFHVLLLLKKQINSAFYNQYLSYGEKKPDSFIVKWAFEISKKTGISVSAGHERQEKTIILDSSNTPSGKLARAPFSLHISKKGEIDGVAVPVPVDKMKNKNLISKLKSLTPGKVLDNLGSYRKLL